ncbi:MAG TPA: AsmA-like C-terminal region-containing protein [Candidatus Binatia bacterium]|nr:AsmA-like C-terminal region-containing protein [Candidatus Binatia bacterium]
MQVQVEERPPRAALTEGAQGNRRVLIATAAVLAGIAVLVAVVAHKWPFTRNSVIQALQQQSGSVVQVGNFRYMFFPHPGCVAGQVTFRRGPGPNAPPLMTVRELTIVGSYHGLLTHHISTIRADGIHLLIRRQAGNGGSAPVNVGLFHSGLTIGQIIADGVAVEFAPTEQRKQPLVFRVPKLGLHDVADSRPLAFQATVQLPYPPADVGVVGKFGPWQPGNPGVTRLSGSYSVGRLDLGSFSGIRGTLAASGNFDGPLQHLDVQGSTDVPNFVVTEGGHPLHLITQFHATVNGLNGDVALDPVAAHWGRTTVICDGSVAGDGNGKTFTMQIYSTQARVQDLLRPFVEDGTPPMTGSITFQGRASLPPENRPFIDKVTLEGDFGIRGGQYTSPETQRDIDVLSARARGKADEVEDINDKVGNNSYDPGRVLSNVKGHVALRDAVAKLGNITFDVPGASARVSGTYQLKTEKIDLRGHMWLDTKLSKATTGVKSFLLKIIQPLTRAGKHKGAIVSLKIGGTYQHPTYTVLPTAKK